MQKTTMIMKAESFKRMDDPSSDNSHTKHVGYVQCSTIPEELYSNWMAVNPRERKMSTNTAKKIKESLERNNNFHELNRGILLSVDTVTYDNKSKNMTITMTDFSKHGNIDGGHTLRAILDLKQQNMLPDDRYVFFELITGIDSPVELAEARNTSVQVDLKSIEELKDSFATLKEVLDSETFKNRIQYKMNEYYEDDIQVIDVREIIAIISMFSQNLYPKRNADELISDQPIQCYSGKEASLRKFINLGVDKRNAMLLKMKNIIPDIFDVWENVEMNFANYALKANKRYGTRKYAKYDDGKDVGQTLFKENNIQYIVPKGLLYPIVGSFRSLIEINQETGLYEWKIPPKKVWENIGERLVGIVLDEKIENPDVLAKNQNLWSNLFKEVFIYAYL